MKGEFWKRYIIAGLKLVTLGTQMLMGRMEFVFVLPGWAMTKFGRFRSIWIMIVNPLKKQKHTPLMLLVLKLINTMMVLTSPWPSSFKL